MTLKYKLTHFKIVTYFKFKFFPKYVGTVSVIVFFFFFFFFFFNMKEIIEGNGGDVRNYYKIQFYSYVMLYLNISNLCLHHGRFS